MPIQIARVVMICNLTKDPELRYTPSNTAVCAMRVAWNDRERVNEQWQDRANFATVTVFGNRAETCANHLRKGSQIGVDGKLRFESWDKDGQHHETLKIVADNVEFLARYEGAGSGGGGRARAEYEAPSGDFAVPSRDFPLPDAGGVDDDIPF